MLRTMSRKVRTRPRPAATTPRRDPWLFAVLGLTLLAYLPALGNDFVNWDDDHYVYNNPKLREGRITSLPSHFLERKDGRLALPNVMGNYHPLTMISLQVDTWLSGRDVPKRAARETDLRATAFHVTNVALHLAN